MTRTQTVLTNPFCNGSNLLTTSCALQEAQSGSRWVERESFDALLQLGLEITIRVTTFDLVPVRFALFFLELDKLMRNIPNQSAHWSIFSLRQRTGFAKPSNLHPL